MSTSDTFQIFSFDRYNAEQVIEYFNVAPEDTVTREAMAFRFRQTRDSYTVGNVNKASFLRDIAQETILLIEHRYTALQAFKGYFFKAEDKADIDALTIAVICDFTIPDANAPIDAEDQDNVSMRRDFIDDFTLARASYIWEVAQDLERFGYPDEYDPELFREALFLAHINMFQTLLNLELGFDELENDVLQKTLETDFPPARSFAAANNVMGAELIQKMDMMQKRIEDRLFPPPPKPSGPRGSHLRLIQG